MGGKRENDAVRIDGCRHTRQRRPVSNSVSGIDKRGGCNNPNSPTTPSTNRRIPMSFDAVLIDRVESPTLKQVYWSGSYVLHIVSSHGYLWWSWLYILHQECSDRWSSSKPSSAVKYDTFTSNALCGWSVLFSKVSFLRDELYISPEM